MANILFLDMFANAGLARLPQLLSREGNQCSALAFEGKLLLRTAALQHRFTFPDGARLGPMKKMAAALANALKVSHPDFLITSDEVLIRNLTALRQNLRNNSNHNIPIQKAVLHLLEVSLPSDQAVFKRPRNAEELRKAGFQTPDHFSITDWSRASGQAEEFGYPFFLKQSFEAGGTGVAEISDPSSLNKEIKKICDTGLIIGEANPVIGQRIVSGQEITVNFAAWEGRLLGYDVIQALKRRSDNGPSSVVQIISRPELETPIRRLIQNLNYSGFGGLDMFENNNAALPLVIEANFRPTHSLQVSPQLKSSLIRRFSNALNRTEDPPINVPANIVGNTAAIFPDEFLRDRNSPYLANYPTNVPWDDPLFLNHCLEQIGVFSDNYEGS